MYVRVVRFTDVDPERVAGLVAQVEASDGPPEGVDSTGISFAFDEAQGTAVVLQYFATQEAMEAGAAVLGAMDAAQTPGTRASVDTCEIKVEKQAS